MVISKYCHFFKSEKYGYLLYSGETNSFAKISEELYNQLLIIEKTPEKIADLSKDVSNELIRSRVLVEIPTQIIYDKKLRYYYKSFESTNLELVIAPTRACNFNCPYCYEVNKPIISMNEEVEKKIIKFIQKHTRVQRLNITWYGGEPLLKFDTIARILPAIQKETYVRLHMHSMTTNGYLLDEEKCKFFQEYPLRDIQITIDGNKETHDKRRTLIPNIPTYDKIIENIDRFNFYNPNTIITIRTNLDKTIAHTFPEIRKEFNARWWNKGKKVIPYPAFVRDYTESCESNCTLMSRMEKLDFFIDLYKNHNEDINFYPQFCIGGCGATIVNSYVVGPEGELYKCWNDLGIKENIVGYLDSDKIENPQLFARYIAGPTMMDNQECIDCKLFPICEGGCIWERHKNFFQGKNYDYLCHTRKANIDRTFELHYEKYLKTKTTVE